MLYHTRIEPCPDFLSNFSEKKLTSDKIFYLWFYLLAMYHVGVLKYIQESAIKGIQS